MLGASIQVHQLTWMSEREMFMELPLIFQGPKGIFILYDYVISLIAIIVNLAVLRSVIKAKIKLKGYKYFLASLGFSDLFLCLVNVALFITEGFRVYLFDIQCWGQIFRSLGMSGLIVNLLNLSGMSFDHFIGICHPFRYNRLMRRSTVRIAVIILWAFALLLGSAEIPMATVFYLTQEPQSAPETEDVLMQPVKNCGKPETKTGFGDIVDSESKLALLLALADDGMSNLYEYDSYSNSNLTASTDSSEDYPQVIFLRSFASITGATAVGRAESDGDYACIVNTILHALETVNDNPTHTMRKQKSWCRFYRNVPYIEYVIMGLTILCFSIVAFCYLKIFKEVNLLFLLFVSLILLCLY